LGDYILRDDSNGRDIPFLTAFEIAKAQGKVSEDEGYLSNLSLKDLDNPYALIWGPNPYDEDWFKRMADEGHNGKRILFYTSDEMLNNLGAYATHSIEIPSVNSVKKIYQILLK
jgi:hypothetical protein